MVINLNEKIPRGYEEGDSVVAFNPDTPTDVSLVELASILQRIENLEQSAVKYEIVNDPQRGEYPIIQLPDKCKIIAQEETGPNTGVFIGREILGMNKYNEGGPDQFYATEVGNMHVNTTINTADNIAVDTEHGREYVQYISNGGKNVLFGDLSEIGGNVSFNAGYLRILVQRINATEIGAIVSTTNGQNIDVPISRILSGASVEDTVRQVITATPTGVIFDTVTVGQFIIGQYWLSHQDVKYSVVIGSDDTALSNAWLLVGTAYKNTLPED